MSDARWIRHLGLPQIPIMILDPNAFVQIKEDGVRGRCRVAPACDVEWERVTHWRWSGDNSSATEKETSPEDLTFSQCAEERRRLAADRARTESALTLAKRRQDTIAIRDLGHRIQAMTQRASAVKTRQHALTALANGDALKRAAKELLSPDLLRKLYDRAGMIEAELLG